MSTSRIYQLLRVGASTLSTSALGAVSGAVAGGFAAGLYDRGDAIMSERVAMSALGNGVMNIGLGIALGLILECELGPVSRYKKLELIPIYCALILSFYGLQIAGDCLGYMLLFAYASEQMSEYLHDVALGHLTFIPQLLALPFLLHFSRLIFTPNQVIPNQVEQEPAEMLKPDMNM